MLSVIADGGIILLKALGDPGALPRQIMLYREFVRAVFSPRGPLPQAGRA
jgi:TetR/AcrR family transcriptional regulator, transcriptional repressor for nem operon